MNSWAGCSGSDICQTVGAMWRRRQAPGRATSAAHKPHWNSGRPENLHSYLSSHLWTTALNEGTCSSWKSFFPGCAVPAVEASGNRLAPWWWPVAQLLAAPRTQGVRSHFGSKCQSRFVMTFGYFFFGNVSLLGESKWFMVLNFVCLKKCLEMHGKPFFAQVCFLPQPVPAPHLHIYYYYCGGGTGALQNWFSRGDISFFQEIIFCKFISHWFLLVLIDADWCCLVLIDYCGLSLMLVDADWCWMMLIDADC